MYILITDETNNNANEQVKFFIYGGVIIPQNVIQMLDAEVNIIREKYGYQRCDSFKFESRSRPSQVTQENSNKAKEEIIKLCLELGCRFIIYVALHDVIKNTKIDKSILMGADHVIGRFNKFLTENASYGLCFIDRLSNSAEYKYMSSKFTKGLDIPDTKTVSLDRIILYASTCNNASNLSSVVDILLGAFRYSINSPSNVEIAKNLMGKLVTMLWHTREGNDIYALEKGLIFRPKSIKLQKYQSEYDQLLDHLNKLIEEFE